MKVENTYIVVANNAEDAVKSALREDLPELIDETIDTLLMRGNIGIIKWRLSEGRVKAKYYFVSEVDCIHKRVEVCIKYIS